MVRSTAWAGLLLTKDRLHDEHGQPLDVWVPSSEPARDAEGNPVVIGVGVVSPGERLRILALIEARVTKMGGGSRGKGPHTTFLGGIFSCPYCRKGMTGSGGDRGRMYRCRTRSVYGKDACPGVVVRAERMDAAVEAMWLSHVSALEHGSPASTPLSDAGRSSTTWRGKLVARRSWLASTRRRHAATSWSTTSTSRERCPKTGSRRWRPSSRRQSKPLTSKPASSRVGRSLGLLRGRRGTRGRVGGVDAHGSTHASGMRLDVADDQPRSLPRGPYADRRQDRAAVGCLMHPCVVRRRAGCAR